MSSIAVLIDLIGRDGASPALLKMGASADKAAASVARAETGILGFSKKATAALGAVATIDVAGHLVKDAAQFQKSMLLIQTQAGASASMVKQFSGEILKMAGPLGTAPEQLATSLYHVVSASKGLLTSAQQLKIMQTAAEGAKVGNADLEETTNALTAAVASGIPGVQSYAQAMGSLNAIVGSGDMKLSDLNAAMSSGILANMRNFGLSLNDVGSALAVFGDNNIRGADAATMLRTAVSAMAQPVKTGAATLKALNISSTELGADMNKGGLNSALTDLVAHLEAAGKTKSITDLSAQVKGMKGNIDLAAVSSSSLGQLLTEAFGKKTGPGLAVLVSQLDRFRIKEDEIAAGAHNFGSAWAATQKTASFAFDRIRASVEAFGISLGTKALPAVTEAADWLGTTLPADLGKLQSALLPLEHIVGEALVVAWHALAAAMSVAGSALSGVINVIGGHTSVFTDMATATLALWAAFKGVSLAVAGLKALDGALLVAHTRMLAFADSFAAVAAGEKVMSAGAFVGILGAIGVAAYAAGKGMSSIIESNNSFAHVMDNSANSAKSFTQALDDSNGALTASVAKTVAAQLQSVGLADKAHAAGISLNQLTGAVTGTDAQYAALVETWRKGGDVSGDTITALGLMHAQYAKSAAGAKDLATVTGQSTSALAKQAKVALAAATASQNLAQAVKPLASAYDSATQTGKDFLDTVTTFSKSAGTAADQASLIGATLKANAGDALNYAAAMNSAASASKQLGTDIASAAKGVGKSGESTRSFLDSIIKLKSGTIDFGKAAAGPLISDLQGVQTAAINAAEATFQHNKMLEGGKAAADDAVNGYKGVETSLEGQLTKLGLTSKQAQTLTDKYLGVPSRVKTLIEQEGANPVVDVLNKIGAMLARLTGQPWTTTMDGNTAPLTAKINDAQAYINRLKQNRVPGIQVGTDEYYRQLAAANARLNALKQGKIPAVDVDTVPAMTKLRELLAAIPKGTFTYTVAQMNARNADHAAGGYIRGPGSGTSDSIPANLSNGEFVVKASQTAKHLGLLNAINSGARGFAAGGLVSNYSAVASALKALGATNAGIAGFLGSTKIESGGSTTAHNSGENAWGLQQWEGGRLAQLKALAARMGKSFTSQAAQVAMITHELLTGYSSTLKVLRSATDPRKAAAYVDAHYEASSGSARQAREDAAASFYKQLASGKISSSAVAGKAVGVVSTSAITSALFGSGGSFATRLISSVSNSLKGIVEKSGSAVAARAAVISHSTSVVNTAISKGIKPDLAEPDLIAALPNQILHAIGTEKQAEIAQKNYAALTTNVTQLKNAVAQASAVTKNDVNAARAHATALSNEAHNAMQAASAMSGKTAADKANKAAAEAHAKALENQARAASQTATAMSRASSTGKANLEAELKAAQTVAAQAKTAYGTISQAAKDAAAAAAATAKTLVDDVKSDADALTSTIHDFTSSMSQSLTAGTDLSSIIQTLTGDNGGSPPAFDQVAASLQTAATAAQQFGSDLNAVAGAGGSQALVQQIAALGTTTGDAFAKSLLASGGAKAMSDTIASIQTVADTASAGLATSFFGSGANTMIQFIKGLQSQFPALTAALQAIMDSVAAAAGVDASKVQPPKVTTPVAPVKKYAMGTMWHPGGWALVGDAGPELLKLPTGSQVLNNRDMNRMKYPHAGVDTSGIERRLDLLARRLESTQRTIAATPEQTGQHVADASVNGYRVAGAADRRQALRAGRRAAR